MAPKSLNGRELWNRAEREDDRGRFISAFRLYQKAAKAGSLDVHVNLGYCYDIGRGVQRNRKRAMYWYKRAYRRGDYSAASNIGTIYRDEGRTARALYWFRRAVALGLEDANLEIAKLYLKQGASKPAAAYLKKVLRAHNVCEASQDEARELLKRNRS